MPSAALNEIRRLRRDRYGQSTKSNRLNLTRRTLYPSSIVENSSSGNNVPRQRHRGQASKLMNGSPNSKERDESLTSALLDANYLEMKSAGVIPSVRRDFGHSNMPDGLAVKEGDYEDEDEECNCFPAKDIGFWRRRLRDFYILFFILMFVGAFMVHYTLLTTPPNQETIDLIREIEIKKNATLQLEEQRKTDVKTNLMAQLLISLQDLTVPYNKSIETPLLLDIPLTGSSIVKTTLSKCHELTMASQEGLQQPNFEEDILETFVSQRKGFDATYVNVDTSTKSGIQRAFKLDLVPSRSADVITVSNLHDSTILFQGTNYRGRVFAMFSHPTARAVGYYHYIKKATWDSRYSPDVEEMTLLQFATSKHIEKNPMVRFFTEGLGLDPNRKLGKSDLQVAMKVVERKFLIGIYRDMKGSLARFDRYFGWSMAKLSNSTSVDADEDEREEAKEKHLADVKVCRSKLISEGDRWMQKQQKSKVKIEDDERDLIEKANVWDLKLYNHIELIFEAQGENIFNVV